MMDFSQVLHDKIDTIIEKWVEAVRQDEQIEAAKDLTYKGVRNSLPIVLQAIVTMLSPSQDSDIKTLVETSLEHGILRAKQGYDAEEMAREYRLVRWTIFSVLEEDLLKGSPSEVIRAMRLIDTALDEVIARCFKSFTEERLRELQELQSQLQLTNQELTRLLRANQDNLSHLAHELKTPLTSIIGYSDLFLRLQRNNSATNDTVPNLGHIERVLNSGRQLLHLINDTLEISRYQAGKMKLQPKATDVRSIVSNIVEMVEPLAHSKKLEIVVQCDRAPERIITDCLRLQQIITNLLSNAIRYTDAGVVTLTCEVVSDKQWAIAVTDTGIGISTEDQKRIFDAYFRAGKSSSLLPESTGLGLAIVLSLVKLLQGKIELVSEVGVGSTFTVTLPLEVKISEAMLEL